MKNTTDYLLSALINAIPHDVILHVSGNENDIICVSEMASAPVCEDIKAHFTANLMFHLPHKQDALNSSQLVIYSYEHQANTYQVKISRCRQDEVLFIIKDITQETDNDKELLIKTELYAGVLDSTNIDIAVFDEDNKYVLIGKQAVKDDELRQWMIGKTDFDYCRHRGRDIRVAKLRTEKLNLLSENKYTTEWLEESSDASGKKSYHIRQLVPFIDSKGRFFKIGYGFNVTNLKNAEREILHREYLLNYSHKLAKLGYWLWYPDTKTGFLSNGMLDILEIPKKLYSNPIETFLQHVFPDDLKLVEKFLNKDIELANIKTIEYRIVTPSGKIKTIENHLSYNPELLNDAPYILSVIQDCSDFIKARADLANSEEHFRAIAENSPNIIIEIDLAGTVLYLNRVYPNHRMEDFLGKSSLDILAPNDQENFAAAIKIVLETGKIQSLEIQAPGTYAEFDWYLINIGPLKSADGKFKSLIVMSQNITESKRNHHEKEQLITELNEKFNELMQFNYIVSHNLRSPLANILGMTGLLKESNNEEERNQLCDYLINSAHKLDNLVKDLNAILSAKAPLNERVENFSLMEIVEAVFYNLEKQFFDADADLNLNIKHDSITTIKSYIQSCIYNLVSNAIKYKSPARKLIVGISSEKVGQKIIIKVSDNGLGMDLENQAKDLFGLYKRFHPAVEGKGLGLHMTKTQIESIGATLTVESKPDVGTTFTVILNDKPN